MRYAMRSLCLSLLAAALGAAPYAVAQQMEVLDLGNNASIGGSYSPEDIVPVQLCSEPDWCRGYPGWYASGDAIFLKRGAPRRSPLIVADQGTLNDRSDDVELLNAAGLHFIDFESGFRTELGRSFGNGLALEATYLLVDEWDTAEQITTSGLVSSNPLTQGLSPPLQNSLAFYKSDPFDTEQAGTFYEALQQTVVYQSDLNSAEINVKATWQHCQFIRSEYFGLRYVQVREQFTLTSQDEATSTPANGIATYAVDTDNDLIGAQYGQEIGLPLFGCALLSTRLKGGLFVNSAEQQTEIVDNAILRYRARDTDDEVSFVGELNVGLNVKVNKMLSVRGGYNLIWVEGIALAAEQGYPVGLTGFSPINDNGGLFYHGFSLGVQVAR